MLLWKSAPYIRALPKTDVESRDQAWETNEHLLKGTNVSPKSPVLPEARRLEKIRLEYLDGMPMAEFHRHLTRDTGYDISYAAVRNYHSDRKAPVDYYAQVCRVFDIRMEWLLFGEGEMTTPLQMALELQSESPEWIDALARAAPTIWDSGDQVSQVALLDCIRRLDQARPESSPLTPKQRRSLARILDTLIGGALWILRGDKEVPRIFVKLILVAIAHGIPGPRTGSTYSGIMKRMKFSEDGS